MIFWMTCYLAAILLPIKSPVSFTLFWIALFEAVFIVSVVDFLATLIACVALLRPSWLYLSLKLLTMF